MLNFVKSIYWELKSYFVTENYSYEIEGSCKKCGKCCDYMYSKDTYSESEFKFMQFLFPKYKRFYIKGKDEGGNLIFACKLLGENGLCTDYKNRLPMCKNYPLKKLYSNPILHENCGFSIVKKEFKDYLSNKTSG